MKVTGIFIFKTFYRIKKIEKIMIKLENTFLKDYKYTKFSYIANKITLKHYGNKVFLRGLIEFSNHCKCDCLYCGIRKSNSKVKRYRMNEDEILDCVRAGYNKGIRTFVLQSGEDPYYKTKDIIKIIEKIKNIDNDIAITLSIGIKSYEEYKSFKFAGADRYLIRFETSDPKLHKKLRNGISLNTRLKAIENLKKLDYEIGSGFMVGLPDETSKTFFSNIKLSRELELDMIGIGPFIPHPQTPLNFFTKFYDKKTALNKSLYAISLLRINLPLSNIPATTAMGTIHPKGREMALSSGANVLMPNITKEKYKKNYLLYPDKICIDESGLNCIFCLENSLKPIGKTISFERGDSISKKNKNKFI